MYMCSEGDFLYDSGLNGNTLGFGDEDFFAEEVLTPFTALT